MDFIASQMWFLYMPCCVFFGELTYKHAEKSENETICIQWWWLV